MPEDDEPFSKLMVGLDYPMVIVTASAAGERSGCLVGFNSQCSINPPRFAVWLSQRNRTYRVALEAGILAVHFPSAKDGGLAELFGGETGDEVDKFARCGWREGPAAVPVLEEIVRWFAGRIVDRFDSGDHMGFILEPLEWEAGPWPGQLRFQAVKGIDPGHEP